MIRFLFGLNHYEDLEVHSDSGNYKIVGFPVRRISSIEVRGNSQMSDSDVLQVLNVKEGDRPGRPFDR